MSYDRLLPKYGQPNKLFLFIFFLSLIPILGLMLTYILWRIPVENSIVTANCTITNCTISYREITFMLNIQVNKQNYSNPATDIFSTDDDAITYCGKHFVTCYYTDLPETLCIDPYWITVPCDVIMGICGVMAAICWCISILYTVRFAIMNC